MLKTLAVNKRQRAIYSLRGSLEMFFQFCASNAFSFLFLPDLASLSFHEEAGYNHCTIMKSLYVTLKELNHFGNNVAFRMIFQEKENETSHFLHSRYITSSVNIPFE